MAMAIASPYHENRAVPHRGTAIVTGGSRGIGAACCKALSKQGYGVVVAYKYDSDAAAQVCRDIAADGGMAKPVQADVSSDADVRALFEFADGAFQAPLTVLVNNAGILGPRGPLEEVGHVEYFDRVIGTNVAGPMMCCREAERRMSTKRGGAGGSIVQVSSGSAYIGSPLLYAASKGALNSLTIGLVKPLAECGIRINTVSPGMTDTRMVADTAQTFDFTKSLSAEWALQRRSQTLYAGCARTKRATLQVQTSVQLVAARQERLLDKHYSGGRFSH
eukprot:CAMPEP_0119305686 /NCGR_PEP_ID=MMETSP1333-20130426/6624_1 /TAXON_ID=418940 /ORGANISM="Scyphosphaera apsteinii, Strain RCC1455" /LENGTH=276 /DNA_ID=CAMNT_0007308839 /DNA_START=129 /DNA_END=960 /DNA_ORIENTATION=-